jgi:hypothetical protein
VDSGYRRAVNWIAAQDYDGVPADELETRPSVRLTAYAFGLDAYVVAADVIHAYYEETP